MANPADEEIKGLINQEDESFDESVEKSVRNENRKLYALIFIVVFGIVAVLLVGCMLNIYESASRVNEYFGYAVGIVEIILLILLLGVPSIKIFFLPYYSVNKKGRQTAIQRANNNRVAKKVAWNLVDYHTANKGYLTQENLDMLSDALDSGKNINVHNALKNVYDTDVNKKVRSIILKNSCRAFCYTAISQNDKIDSISVLLINIKMIKSILYAYGTRPSFYKLIKIYTRVLINSLVAYGMQNVSVSNILTKFVKASANIIPALGTLIDSAVQGATSSILTLIVGYKTKAYVYEEFKIVRNDELEYNKELFKDPDLAMAINEYNNSKSIMQERASNAKKTIDDGKKNSKNVATAVVTDAVPDSVDTPAKKVMEKREEKEARLADSDLELLMSTGSRISDNSKRKKALEGEPEKAEKPKRKNTWAISKRKKELPEYTEGEVAADVAPIEEKPDDKSKNKNSVIGAIEPDDEIEVKEKGRKRRKK